MCTLDLTDIYALILRHAALGCMHTYHIQITCTHVTTVAFSIVTAWLYVLSRNPSHIPGIDHIRIATGCTFLGSHYTGIIILCSTIFSWEKIHGFDA